MPAIPDALGLGGPITGITGDHLLVAGGANFPVSDGEDLWEVPKVWHKDTYIYPLSDGIHGEWKKVEPLSKRLAYSAVVSTRHGIVCLGGDDENGPLNSAFILSWNSRTQSIEKFELPNLPEPMAYGAAAAIGDVVYVAGGLSGQALESAMRNFWAIDLSVLDRGETPKWKVLPGWPGPARAFNLTLAQHNGFDSVIYVISGRRQIEGVAGAGGIQPLADVYEFNPRTRTWRERASIPAPVMAGTGVPIGQSHLFILSGDDGVNSEVFWRNHLDATSAELDVMHPGFPNTSWIYHTITDTWIGGGQIPLNQVTSTAIRHGADTYLISGEIRPRVRTPEVWRISVLPNRSATFATLDYVVLMSYLIFMVILGLWFSNKNKSTNDYFRGGQRIPWIVAGCSIFATMLSSIAYLAIPAKAYAQDWILMLANLMIPVVAPVAIYLALPFFRRLNITSAYEYLEWRFNRSVRLLGSGLFTLFHIFRMGIVMSLAGLALASFSPIAPAQAVLLMGILCILYSTLGGIKAVVWADTLQTLVLIAGAAICFSIVILRVDGGVSEIISIASADGKMAFANFDFGRASLVTAAVWVVVLGGLGQNLGSYVGDQAVVQRYVSTANRDLAVRSIWTNAIMAVPATLIFFAMGTVLYVFFKIHPQYLDPTMNTDQILPLFITTQVPVGIAGLIAAGVFSATQSTISTSMNSTATTVVTDFLRPFNACKSEAGYFAASRWLTFALGCFGTLLGVIFVDPNILSLFDSFLTGIGLFMGVLAGLFLLGFLTEKAHGRGALLGAVCAFATVLACHWYGWVHWILYATVGIVGCCVYGYCLSRLIPSDNRDKRELIIHS